MVSFLQVLPRSLATFLFALAALLRFYGNTESIPLPFFRLTYLQWSLATFVAAALALVANLSLEWYALHRGRNRDDQTRQREVEARNREIEAREREIRRDRAAESDRELAARERELASQERNRANRERNRADQERERANRERLCAAKRAALQGQCFVALFRFQLDPTNINRERLRDLMALLDEYSDIA
ncbi:hypothetical protein Syn6312_2200 [Synechococcus sp. PCC 6312]|nr:hypothetical protein Syn6312_2200 [Synechococcus sp. PCC 6312]